LFLPVNKKITDRTFEFAVKIVELAIELDAKSQSGRVLGKQILRAGTSIGANVEEAQAGESRADFQHKYNIALKEARELKYWLRLLMATKISKILINSRSKSV
jgi:four helix bundle protein